MGWLQRGYAIGDVSGPELFLKGADLDDASREAQGLFPHSCIMFDGDLASAIHEDTNAPLPNVNPKTMPKRALANSGLKRRYRYEEVMGLSVQDAHAILKPYFTHLNGRPIKRYDRPYQMKSAFLTANAKLVKGRKKEKLPKGVRPGLSRGPNLLPHAAAKKLSNLRLGMKGTGLCVGSNAACRSTCLVYSGQNPLADQQVPIKLRRTEALLKEPAAWIRMFIASIDWHIKNARADGLVPYIRPNVLSDIPWELVFPEMFTKIYPRLRWYDYTKVAGRSVPKSYDLTFSFNGTNESLVDYELNRGHRVAVVFWLQTKGLKLTDLRFMEKRVIDGDIHDFRPLDPKNVVVGLKYKPVVKPGTLSQQYKPPKGARKFVVPAFQDPDTGLVVVAQTPSSTGARRMFRREGSLVA